LRVCSGIILKPTDPQVRCACFADWETIDELEHSGIPHILADIEGVVISRKVENQTSANRLFEFLRV
jgi:enhancing lycopene biosynthesis protein 2